MIQIIVNGKKQLLVNGLNIKEMIVALDYRTKGFAVALNGTFVAIKDYESTSIKSNDTVEILAPVQGG